MIKIKNKSKKGRALAYVRTHSRMSGVGENGRREMDYDTIGTREAFPGWLQAAECAGPDRKRQGAAVGGLSAGRSGASAARMARYQVAGKQQPKVLAKGCVRVADGACIQLVGSQWQMTLKSALSTTLEL